MEVVFLPSARDDIGRMRRHYRDAAHGRTQAEDFRLLRQQLSAPIRPRLMPLARGLREIDIPRTPFRALCRITARRIEVLAVRDTREG